MSTPDPGDTRRRTLAHLDERLAWCRSELSEYERLVQRLETTRRRLAALAARVLKLRERTTRERRDVSGIEGISVAALLETVFGDLRARRQRETEEWLVARLRLREAEEELAATQAEQQVLSRRHASLADPRAEYHRLLAEKSAVLAQVDHQPLAARLHLAERQGVLSDALREFEQALWAGEVARAALTGMLHALSKAQALGGLDFFALSSTWVKREHLEDAYRHASAANRALSRFQMELADVQERHEAHLTLETSQLSTFADYFFDDFLSDWVVNCRIDRTHASASIARTRVNRTLRALARRRHSLLAELQRVRGRLRPS